MRVAAKRDATEPAIVRALELAGWTVVKVSDTGLPDLVVMRRGVVKFLECKSPGGKVTPAQEETFRRFHAALVTVHVVRTPEDALMAVGAPVEGVLKPLERGRCACKHTPSSHHVTAGYCLVASCPCRGALVEQVLEGETSHVVTPAYRKAQTTEVVPKRRKK